MAGAPARTRATCPSAYGIWAGVERRATWSGSPSWVSTTVPATGARIGTPKPRKISGGSTESTERHDLGADRPSSSTATKSIA